MRAVSCQNLPHFLTPTTLIDSAAAPCRWFQSGTNPHTGSQAWLYTGGYFNRNYRDLPDIY